jgi:hypothetical protein
MYRVIPFALLLAMLAAGACGRDSVMATFVWPQATETRLVLYNSGKYEQWLIADGMPTVPYKQAREYSITTHGIQTRDRRPPIEAGTYHRNTTTLAVAINPDPLHHSPSWPTQRLYHAVNHDGVEYLFDERGGWADRFEATHDTNLLRYAWRQERR